MNIKQSIMLTFSALSLFSCFRGKIFTGSGNVVTEKRQTASFTGVHGDGVVAIEIKNGPVAEVVVEADDNLMKYINTEVKGNELVIGIRDLNSFSNCTFKVYVTVPRLESISSSGTGNITSNGVLLGDKPISISASGVGNITAEVDAPEVSVEVSGVGAVTLGGRTKNYRASVVGNGSINSFNLLTENAEAELSGVGQIKLHASVKLKASITGTGNIKYRGNAVVEPSVNGTGSITKE
jgi:hypothetical protein